MIAILFGIFLFLAQISLPGPVDSAVRSLGSMIGPLAMLISGMLIAGTTPQEILAFPPYWTCHDSAAHRCTAFDNFTS